MLNHVSKGGHFLGLFMKIAVFGANGGIGKWVVKYALERGYDVTACVRRMPSQPLSSSDKLRVAIVNTDDNKKMEEIQSKADSTTRFYIEGFKDAHCLYHCNAA